MNITPIRNNIIFTFEDRVDSAGSFRAPSSAGGLYVASDRGDSAKLPRWATAVSVGPDCTRVKAGDRFLLPALRWTNNVKVDDQRVWKTDESEVVAVEHQVSGELTVINQFVVFKPNKSNRWAPGSSMLIVPHTSDETPCGEVVSRSAELGQELDDARIYYSDANFFSKFMHNGDELAFVKQEEVLVYEPKGD